MTNQKQSEPPSPVSVCAHPNPPCFEPLEPRTLLAASMIDDLNPHPIELAPDAGVRLGKALLFPLTTEHGRELWRSSGTRKGTALVRDIKPGRDSSNPEHLTRAGDAVFFSVSNTYNDHTLWKTDGSRTGTTKVRSFEGTGIPSIAAVGRRAVLVANGQLWTTDGSRDGTVKLVGDGLTRVHPTLFRYGNQILFTTSDTGGGASDVWSTDGTLTGTRQIPTAPRDLTLSTARTLGDAIIYAAGGRLRRTDLKTTTDLRTINSDAFEARIIPLAVLDDDTLLFSANDGTHGHELWTTDGTPEGTRLLKDLAPGFGSSLPGYATRDFAAFDGLLFFTARVDGKERLFRSDGTDAGTFAIDRDLSDIQNLTLFRDRLYVSALNTSHQPVVLQPDRQRRFLTVSPNYHPVSSYVGAVNGRALYVRADQLGALWSGSAPHGRKSKPVFSSPHTRGSDPSNVLSVGDDLYFVTRMPRSDEYHWPDEADFALWRRSGNGKPVKLLEHEGGGYLVPDPFGNLTALPDGTVLFTVLTAYGAGSSHDPTQGEAHIWRTDGTPKGTYSLTKDTGPVTNGYYFYFVQQTLFADQLYFLKTPTHEYFTMPGEPGELWTTDGTLDGTTKVADDVSDFTRFQGALHYGTTDGTIWRLDEDEPEQPRLVTSLPPHAGDTFINLSTSDDERLYFSAWRQFERMELWSTDGTAAGTERMGSRDHSLSYEPPFFRPVIASDGRAFFTLNTFEDGQAFTDLYATDGTADGTRVLRRFPTAEIYYDAAEHLTTVNDTLFFAAYEASTGRELWKSDGTPNGTVIVKDIVPGKGSSYPSELTARDGLLYFNTYIDSVTSRWRSDGTAEGTVPNTEHPQPLPDYPPLSITFGDARIYPHFDERYGLELWTSDDDGDRLLLDLVPGPAGSNPTPLAIHNGKLIFSANDGIHGDELWELDLDD